MKTACKDGMCQCIFEDDMQCDYKFKSKLMICVYMQQSTGRCLHTVASKRPDRPTLNTNNDYFYQRACASAAEYWWKRK